MDYIKTLTKLGLSKNEARIYADLLEKGSSLISDIYNRTGIHRPIVYKTVSALKEKKLIYDFPRGRRKFYAVESPEKLNHILEISKKELKDLMPKVEEIYGFSRNRPTVKMLEGRERIKDIFNDIVTNMKRGDVFYRYSSRKPFEPNFLPKNYKKLRNAKQLQRLVITNEEIARQKKPDLNRIVKVVPEKYGLFDYGIIQLIYGNKIAFIDINTKTAVVIENDMIAEFQKKIFKICFDLL